MRVVQNHYMNRVPLNPDAWPNYRHAAEHAGLIVVATLLEGLDEIAVTWAREACRNAWIDIWGRMTIDELKSEGF